MRLTLHTDYALRMLIHLAVNPGHQRIDDVARAYGVSANHMMKVAQRLTQLGFVNGKRGRGGGLSLAREPDVIIIGDVVRRMEETGQFVECEQPGGHCRIAPRCGLRRAFAGATEAFLRHLDQYSLADIVGDSTAMARLFRKVA